MTQPGFLIEREKFHTAVKSRLFVIDSFKVKKGADKGKEVPAASNADAENTASRTIANAIANTLSAQRGARLPAQSAGDEFESAVADFVKGAFGKLAHLRPGNWSVKTMSSRSSAALSEFEQYRHLAAIAKMSKENPELAVALGNDYQISPDVIVLREQEPDAVINKTEVLVDSNLAKAAALRQTAKPGQLLHASVSCKWTIRSDRAQNSRSEALNLIRNRKGRVPHIVVVTGEPLPSRLSSLGLGTGDIDCIYHFALYELVSAVKSLGQSEAEDLLSIMIEGGRLKDISDLPLDLAV